MDPYNLPEKLWRANKFKALIIPEYLKFQDGVKNATDDCFNFEKDPDLTQEAKDEIYNKKGESRKEFAEKSLMVTKEFS